MRACTRFQITVKELFYAYAIWISPAFHLTAIRAFDELANTEGLFTLRDSAKLCGWPEKLFIQKLLQSPVKWLYVHSSSGRKLAYAKPIKAGYMDVKQVTVFHKTTGRETYGQPMITQKGLTTLATKLGAFTPHKEVAA